MGKPDKTHAQREVSQRAYEETLALENNPRLLRRPQVEARTGLSRSTIYDWMKRGEFPQPVKLGERLVAWRESDVNAWLVGRQVRNA